MSNDDNENGSDGQPIATPSKPTAAFPQGQAAFPNASTPKPIDTRSALDRIMNELGGPKPAY
jgi:hypothetical protein